MSRSIICAVLLALAIAAPSIAQDSDGEDAAIVVTGSRYRDAYQDFVVPHVAIVRRADAAAMGLTISSDTRDANARSEELRQALQSLAHRAQAGAVTLGILDDDGEGGQTRVRAFSIGLAMTLLRAGARPDTSQISILTRTPVGASDTRDSVEDRLNAFRTSMQRPGRVEALGGDLDLVVINPPQYRAQIIANITTDAGRIAAGLGPNYGARIEGLENPIAWKRAGDLELRLFIPYRLVVMPRDSTAS